MNQRNEAPRAMTRWIGGSYLAACGGRLPPVPTTSRILQKLEKSPGATTVQLSLSLHLSQHTISHALIRLKAAGCIFSKKISQKREVGGGPVNHWYISPKGLES